MSAFKYEVLYTYKGNTCTTFINGPDYWTHKSVIKKFKDDWVSYGEEKEDLTSIEVLSVMSWSITD